MNVVNEYGEKRNGFAEVVSFCHVTYRYFHRFLLQGVDKNWCQACLFYLAPGLICEGYWQVSSRKVDFSHCGPYLLLLLSRTADLYMDHQDQQLKVNVVKQSDRATILNKVTILSTLCTFVHVLMCIISLHSICI